MAAALKDDLDIFQAALAGLYGHGDFMALLALPSAERDIADAVIACQQRILRQWNGGA